MKATFRSLLLLVFGGFPITVPIPAIEAKDLPLFSWDLLWTGYYYNSLKTEDGDLPPSEELMSGGTLFNRGNLSLGLPRLDLSLRFMVTDKRLLPLEDDDGKAGFNPGFGLYHHGSGSRFLYGVQSEYGLPARINNVWLRGIPFMENRSPSSRDFKTEPAAKDKNESYLYLALPYKLLPGFDVFASAALDEGLNPAFGGGLGLGLGGVEMRLEGFYANAELPPRTASTWFSAAPPLPEREFNIYALAAIFNSRNFAVATDWAFSETFAWGRGLYGNAAVRLGNKPWRLSLAGDGASSRFSDRSGSTAGAGFRFAAKGERFWQRSGLLRFQGSFRSAGLKKDFDRGAVSLYFRPSAPTAAEKRNNPLSLRFSRASLSVNRDARKPEKTVDSLNGLAAFNLGPLSSSLSFSLHSLSSLEEDTGIMPVFVSPFFESFDSFKLSGELGWVPNFRFGALDLRARLGYTIRAEKKNLWEPSLGVSLRSGKWGRIGFRIASTDFPEKWNYTLSWRFQAKKSI